MSIVLHVTRRIIWREGRALALRDEARLKSRCFRRISVFVNNILIFEIYWPPVALFMAIGWFSLCVFCLFIVFRFILLLSLKASISRQPFSYEKTSPFRQPSCCWQNLVVEYWNSDRSKKYNRIESNIDKEELLQQAEWWATDSRVASQRREIWRWKCKERQWIHFQSKRNLVLVKTPKCDRSRALISHCTRNRWL